MTNLFSEWLPISFRTFTSSTIGSFAALFLVKYQFEIVWCLYFPQLINCPFFWSMPVGCSWRQLSSELVVTMVKENQEGENYIWGNSHCPRNSHTSYQVTQNTPISGWNWSKYLGKQFRNNSRLCNFHPGVIWAFCLRLTQVGTCTKAPSQGVASPEFLCTDCKSHNSNQTQVNGLLWLQSSQSHYNTIQMWDVNKHTCYHHRIQIHEIC